jgi:hypothetical protein
MSCWFVLCSRLVKRAAYVEPWGPLCQSACSCRWHDAHRSTRGATSPCRMWICSGDSPREWSHTRLRFFACIRKSAVKELPWQSWHVTFR